MPKSNKSKNPVRTASGSTARSYRSALMKLNSAQKPSPGTPPYTLYVNRRLARYVAAWSYKAHLTPNQLTLLGNLFTVAGVALLVTVAPSIGSSLVIALLFVIGYVIDSADGQLARLTGSSSRAGEWLDHTLDAVTTPLVHFAVLVGLWRFMDINQAWLLVPILFSLSSTTLFFAQSLSSKIRPSAGQGAPAQVAILPRLRSLPVDYGVLCWIFVFWSWGIVFVVCYAILCAFHAGYSSIWLAREYRQLSSPAS